MALHPEFVRILEPFAPPPREKPMTREEMLSALGCCSGCLVAPAEKASRFCAACNLEAAHVAALIEDSHRGKTVRIPVRRIFGVWERS